MDDEIWKLRFGEYGVLDLAQWWARTATGTDAIAAAVLIDKLALMGAKPLQQKAARDQFTISEPSPG